MPALCSLRANKIGCTILRAPLLSAAGKYNPLRFPTRNPPTSVNTAKNISAHVTLRTCWWQRSLILPIHSWSCLHVTMRHLSWEDWPRNSLWISNKINWREKSSQYLTMVQSYLTIWILCVWTRCTTFAWRQSSKTSGERTRCGSSPSKSTLMHPLLRLLMSWATWVQRTAICSTVSRNTVNNDK